MTQTEREAVDAILAENRRRRASNEAPFDPISGLGSTGRRVEFSMEGGPLKRMWLPEEMMATPFMKELAEAGDLRKFLHLPEDGPEENEREATDEFIEAFARLRSRYDFPFWAAAYVSIQSKEPGEGEIPFVLTRPQRKFVEKLEEKRVAGKPIRLVLLKARQWGGSTTSQLYMAWLQLVHRRGLNSVIVSQTKKTSFAIKDMYDRALKSYPVGMLHAMGEPYSEGEAKMVNVGQSGDYKRIVQRDCKITIASYEAPDSIRGDNYSLVHCSEVGLWTPTLTKSPDSVVRAACSGVLLRPYTMIIYESTANGTDNFFQREYDAAKRGKSLFDSLFISWYDIDLYRMEIAPEEMEEFALRLYSGRESATVTTNREEPGRYLWWLWEQGATLEGINWYITERRGKESHAVMASEYPTDDDEAFQHSGAMVFDRSLVNRLKSTCCPPGLIGEVIAPESYAEGEGHIGRVAMWHHGQRGTWRQRRSRFDGLRFVEDPSGSLWVWNLPEGEGAYGQRAYGEGTYRNRPYGERPKVYANRYLTVVDIGGRSAGSDFSVILVIDRLPMAKGEKPAVVAQWYGHTDMDLLAWKAAEIATFYENALLVIESNTLDSRDPARGLEGGDQSYYLFNQLADEYPNLYARAAPSDAVVAGGERRWGFHTNIHTKPMIISGLQKYIREEAYVERDERCVSEYLFYEKRPNGSFGAVAGKHDDLLMTRAIGLHVCFNEMDLPVERR